MCWHVSVTDIEQLLNSVLAGYEELLRPDSTTAKFFARNCVCEIRMATFELE